MKVSEFMIGVKMNNLIKIIIIYFTVLPFFSCQIINQIGAKDTINTNIIELDIVKSYKSIADSMEITIYYRVPINRIIYRKENNQYIANIRNQIMITNKNNNALLIDKIFYNEDMKYDFYSTKVKNKYFNESFNFILPVDIDASISVEVTDWNNNNNKWSARDEISTSYEEGLSDIAIYSQKINKNIFLINKKINKSDSVLIEFQYFENNKNMINENFKYLFLQYGDTVRSGKVFYEDGYYRFYSDIDESILGDFNLIIHNNKLIKEFPITITDGLELWSKNINEIIGPMQYILSDIQYAELVDMKDNDKINFVKNFWIDSDPSIGTDENELLIEFTKRIAFANDKFSIADSGWKTDKGKIYIKYGEPFLIQQPYEDEFGNVFEVWKYDNGKVITFIDRGMFGDFKIYRSN